MAKESMKCKCNAGSFGWMILGVILLAAGIWAFVSGLKMQWSGSADWLLNIVWYALGLLLACLGKMCKWKASSCCPAHACK